MADSAKSLKELVDNYYTNKKELKFGSFDCVEFIAIAERYYNKPARIRDSTEYADTLKQVLRISKHITAIGYDTFMNTVGWDSIMSDDVQEGDVALLGENVISVFLRVDNKWACSLEDCSITYVDTLLGLNIVGTYRLRR